jgi:septal ring factor EnvC (AmiA/AmiB activator)
VKLKIVGIFLSGLILTGCMVPQSRCNDFEARSVQLEKILMEKNQELAKKNKEIQTLVVTNKTLLTELAKSKTKIIGLDNELRENHVLTETLLKQLKNVP